MGYEISFRANESYGASALNAISADFNETVGTDFEDGIAYGVDKLNEIRQDIVTKGIARGVSASCACSISGSTVKIGGGKVFFSSGVRAVIDSNGMSVPYTAGSSGNVWLEYSAALGELALKYTATEPTGEYVRIARITNGVLADAREYCYMKNDSLLPNRVYTTTQTLQFPSTSTRTLIKTIVVGESGYKRLLVYANGTDYGNFCGWIDLTTNACYGVYARTGSGYIKYAGSDGLCMYMWNSMNGLFLTAEYDGANLKLYGSGGYSFSVSCNLMLF